MKKLISLLMAIMIFILPCFTAFAAEEEPAHGDYYISEEDFMKLEHVSSEDNGAAPYASGLIYQKGLNLAINGNDLIIQAYTTGTTEVVKCGFKYITLRRYEGGAWKDYVTFNDIYSDSDYCYTSKYVAAARGYSYRVTARHYAKKSLISTEKIDNISPEIWFQKKTLRETNLSRSFLYSVRRLRP